jgi:tetratricopeptide (TPR) repeat protein
LTQGNYEGAVTEVERALAISPNLASGHGILGSTLIFSGRPREGLSALEKGIRLDPRDPRSGVSVNQVVLALYFSRDYEGAIQAAKQVIHSYPDHPLVYRWLAAALGQAAASTRPVTRSQRPSRSRPPRSIFMSAAAHPGTARRTTPTRSKVCAKPAGRADAAIRHAPRVSGCGRRVCVWRSAAPRRRSWSRRWSAASR